MADRVGPRPVQILRFQSPSRGGHLRGRSINHTPLCHLAQACCANFAQIGFLREIPGDLRDLPHHTSAQ
ncbi:hypothetical protein SBA4_4120014 [Candidatus Sulfopaludibacter sp. SbA4]|nr:hypothetical protein SBA4_4120014 [Candidatus Sulfopaludibacter sp. SbA4]